MARTAIDTVVFDIGWVLVRFNYQPIIDLLRARGCEVDDLHAVLERHARDAEAFAQHVTRLLAGGRAVLGSEGLERQAPLAAHRLARLDAAGVVAQ